MAFGIVGGTNYDDYTRWGQRKMPDGRTLYEVPGGGYLFDPTTSSMKGKVIVFRDNKAAHDDAQKLQDQQEFNASPTGQMIPILGTTAGTVGGALLIDSLRNKAVAETGKEVAKDVVTDTATKEVGKEVAKETAEKATSDAVTDAAAEQGAEQGGTGFLANLGGSGVYEAGAANPLGMAGGAVALAAYLSNMYEGGGKDIIRGKGNSSDYTNLFLDINPVTAPVNMALRGLGMDSVGKMLFGQKTTGQIQRERIDNLLKEGKINQGQHEAWVASLNAPYTGYGNKGGRQDTHQAADFVGTATDDKGNTYNVNNKFAQSRNEADLTVDDTLGATSHYEMLGKKYMDEWSDEDRRKYNQRLLDAGLIREKKGGLYYNDEKAAQAIADGIDAERSGKQIAKDLDKKNKKK